MFSMTFASEVSILVLPDMHELFSLYLWKNNLEHSDGFFFG